ncbi:hypothetical protein A5643_08870 [Mycobacterium sp. 1274756.6]|nr:hypothetical protein A5643_08870 [Mycobacterium sp. 1274756.6]
MTVELTTSCEAGDLLYDPAFELVVTDSGRDVAAGTFDLFSDAVAIPADTGAVRTFVFPAGTYWRPPDLLSNHITLFARGSGTSVSPAAASSNATTLTATGVVSPQYGTAEDAAESGLIDLADTDRSIVSSSLENQWVPQISSKELGLVAEGITWNYTDILAEHLTLRQRYDEVRLVRSGDWRTFSGPSWWVTVVGLPHSSPDGAIDWCEWSGLDADHCYAKVISNTHGIEGTTQFR